MSASQQYNDTESSQNDNPQNTSQGNNDNESPELPSNLEAHTQGFIAIVGKLGTHDEELWWDFVQEFHAFSDETFRLLNGELIRTLRTTLRENGVYVSAGTGTARMTVSRALWNCLREPDPPVWPEEDLRKMRRSTKFNSE
jgi:hypothetical protein